MGLQITLKALSDPVRREILELLKQRRMAAGEICEHFDIPWRLCEQAPSAKTPWKARSPLLRDRYANR